MLASRSPAPDALILAEPLRSGPAVSTRRRLALSDRTTPSRLALPQPLVSAPVIALPCVREPMIGHSGTVASRPPLQTCPHHLLPTEEEAGILESGGRGWELDVSRKTHHFSTPVPEADQGCSPLMASVRFRPSGRADGGGWMCRREQGEDATQWWGGNGWSVWDGDAKWWVKNFCRGIGFAFGGCSSGQSSGN